MNRTLSLALLAGGITLLVLGAFASDSIGSDFTRFFSGTPTDKTIWLLLGGAAATTIGIYGLFRGAKIP